MEETSENSEVGHEPGSPYSSTSVDQSPTGITWGVSIMSVDSFTYYRTNSEISDEINSSISETPSPRYWPLRKSSPNLSRLGVLRQQQHREDDQESLDLELEMMKERFSKLLLGEDMSGSGKGVCTALTISNSITNLYASVFGQHQRLEPLHPEKKLMWKREMNCILSVCDFIVELVPTSQNLQGHGTILEDEVIARRSDIHINLPALRKLDAMLLDILESFEETEFWYAEKGSMSGKSTLSGSFRRVVSAQPQRAEEKWWLPVPCVSSSGLSDSSRKHLKRKRDAANQIHKAAMAINSAVLAEMEVPDSYMASLPKSGKASLGDTIYRYMCTTGTEKFSPDHLLDYLNISSEHEALELADRVEASMYTWRRKACISHSKSSWDLMKDLVSEVDRSDKNHVLGERAEVVLLCLKQRYPQLSQTSLDTCKIQYNMDVGQAILESYSRVLEGLAFNIVAWVDDVIFVDKTTKSQDH